MASFVTITHILGSIALVLLWFVGMGIVRARLDDLRLAGQPRPDAMRSGWWAWALGDARNSPAAARPWVWAWPVPQLGPLLLLVAAWSCWLGPRATVRSYVALAAATGAVEVGR